MSHIFMKEGGGLVIEKMNNKNPFDLGQKADFWRRHRWHYMQKYNKGCDPAL